MELNEYEKRAMETCLPESDNVLYMLLELGEENGELMGKFAKGIRHGTVVFNVNEPDLKMSASEQAPWLDSVLKEAGDILWGIAGLCHTIGIPLEVVAEMNLEKLADRKKRDVLDGSGDNR